jgi:signal transduction histidine kinase
MTGLLVPVLGGLAGVLLVVVVVLAVRLRHLRRQIRRDLLVVRAEQNKLQASAEDLRRSNYELEQFAYLASHDLQEPLRKVASFCQLLQRRYAGQLDARADQYIEFAVDGARRMQALINDLLAFSRAGQAAPEPLLVSSDSALTQARANLAEELEKSGATIEAGHLPLVLAEMSLLTAVFQNLLSNALKFAGDGPPRGAVLAVLVHRLRHGDRPCVRRAHLRALPAPQRPQLPGHRDRPGHVPEDHRELRRPDLAGHHGQGGDAVLLHPAHAGRDTRGAGRRAVPGDAARA